MDFEAIDSAGWSTGAGTCESTADRMTDPAFVWTKSKRIRSFSCTRTTEGSAVYCRKGMLAFTFPGQGSQRPGMGRPWADHESWELVGEASEIAERDIGKLLLDADADELRDTRNAQLTTYVSSLMVLDAAERLGIEPSFCAGHSLGEYTALTATGALGFGDGVALVIARANAMHDAGTENPGTMAAVLGLDDEQVDVACRRADADVWVANYNAPGQVVIAGSPDGVAAAADHAKALGAKKVMPLQV